MTASTTPPPIMPAEIPRELDRWNWGAFLLNWIWGIGNNTFIALLTLIPGIGFIMMVVLGFRGSRWAWKNGRWDSVEHFRRVQRLWAIWGVVIWVGTIVLFGGIFGGVFYGLRHSDAYELGVAALRANADAVTALGTPIETGNPMGKISTDGASGQALLNFSATGPKGSGQIFLEAIKRNGAWSLRNLRLKVDGRNDEIDLLKQTRVEVSPPSVIASAAKQSSSRLAALWIASSPRSLAQTRSVCCRQ